MKCDTCGREVESRREEIEHILDAHDDTITSHQKDELKRELNQLDDGGGGGSFPVRTAGMALLVLAVLVGGGYVLAATGVISASLGGGGGTGATDAALGPAGSTHEHAQFSVIVNGDEIDFSQPRYQVQQTRNRKVHFEGGDGSKVHKHATGVTIGYTLGAHGMGINATCLTVDADTYCENGTASLEVTVNGETVPEPSSYVIQDGDVIRVSYGSS